MGIRVKMKKKWVHSAALHAPTVIKSRPLQGHTKNLQLFTTNNWANVLAVVAAVVVPDR